VYAHIAPEPDEFDSGLNWLEVMRDPIATLAEYEESGGNL